MYTWFMLYDTYVAIYVNKFSSRIKRSELFFDYFKVRKLEYGFRNYKRLDVPLAKWTAFQSMW